MVKRIIATAMFALAVNAAGAEVSSIWFSGWLIDPVTSFPWAGRFSATLSVATSREGGAVRVVERPVVSVGDDGAFGFAADLGVMEVFDDSDEAWIRAVFVDGGRTNALPVQQVGFVPYAVHVVRAYAADVDAQAVSRVDVTDKGRVRELRVDGNVNVAEAIVVTNDVAWAEGEATQVSIDSLVLGAGSTSMLCKPDAEETLRCESSLEAAFEAAGDGVAELRLSVPSGAVMSMTVRRQEADGGEETLLEATIEGSTDGEEDTVQTLSYPVCRGDKLAVSAASAGGESRLTWRLRLFGVKTED